MLIFNTVRVVLDKKYTGNPILVYTILHTCEKNDVELSLLDAITESILYAVPKDLQNDF